MNEYELKREARRERYLELASKAEHEAERRAKQGTAMFDAIPFGQPILIGHHSESRDRAYRARASRQFEQSNAASEKAAYYQGKAAGMDAAGISGDDPEAAAKIRAKIAELEADQKQMKAANRVIQQHARRGTDVPLAALVAVGLTERQAAAAVTPDFCGRVGFPGYALQNNNANIRRYRQRLADMERAGQRQTRSVAGPDFAFKLDAEENRVMFEFDGRPDEATRDLLKREGFHWSPTRTAWVRQWTANGEHAGRRVQKALAER